jgi:hypothetical protein
MCGGPGLARWHLNYESVDPYPVREQNSTLLFDPANERVEAKDKATAQDGFGLQKRNRPEP